MLFSFSVGEVMDGIWVTAGTGVSAILLGLEWSVVQVLSHLANTDCFKVGSVDLFVTFSLTKDLRSDIEDVPGGWDACDDSFVQAFSRSIANVTRGTLLGASVV